VGGGKTERDGTETGPQRPQDDAGRLHRRVNVWIDGGRVTLRSGSLVVTAPVELATVDARPGNAVDVEVDGNDERQRHIERTDRREHRVAKVLTNNAVDFL